MEGSSELTVQVAFKFSVNLVQFLEICQAATTAEVFAMKSEGMRRACVQRIRLEFEDPLFEDWKVQPDHTTAPDVEYRDPGSGVLTDWNPDHYTDWNPDHYTDWDPDYYCVFSITSPMLPATEATYDLIGRCADAIRVLAGITEAILFDKNTPYEVTVGRGSDGVGLRELQKLYTLLLCGGDHILNDVHPEYQRFREHMMPCTYSFMRIPTTNNVQIARQEAHMHVGYLELMPEAWPWAEACDAGHDIKRFIGGEAESPHIVDRNGEEKTEDGELPSVTIRLQYIWRANKAALFDAFFEPEVAYAPCLPIPFPTRPIPDSSKEDRWSHELEDETLVRGIKFRQGSGDLMYRNDEEYPVVWAKVAVGLLKWAIEVDEESFRRTVKEVRAVVDLGADQKKTKVETLLKGVGIPEDVVEYMMKRADMMRGPNEPPEKKPNIIRNAASSALQNVFR